MTRRSAASPPSAAEPPAEVVWWVYVLAAVSARRTYVGSTTDVLRRLRQHNGVAKGGASATRAHRPWRLALAFGPLPDRSHAQRIEVRVKRARGRDRLKWPEGALESPRMSTRSCAAINRGWKVRSPQKPA